MTAPPPAPFLRPAVRAALLRHREALAAAALAALGLWTAAQGGVVAVPVGLVLAALGAGWGVLSLRRARFAQGVEAPGVVEVEEGQIGYLGPVSGGYAALADLAEVRLVSLAGRRLWRLTQTDGQVLAIPVDAEGAERLFDAFASLPGMDTGALVAALDRGGAAPGGGGLPAPAGLASVRIVWRRPVARVTAG